MVLGFLPRNGTFGQPSPPTPPASEVGDRDHGQGDCCMGCRRIQHDEELRHGHHVAERMPSTATITNGLSLLHNESSTPERIHELKHDSSVLALAVSNEYIFAGTHDGEILVWTLGTFQLFKTIQAHKRSVLCLFLSEAPVSKQPSAVNEPPSADSADSADSSDSSDSRSLLVSSAGDAIVSVWCPKTFSRLYEIYSVHDVGDIFSVAYSRQQDTVYIGAQNTTIQWIDLKDSKRKVPSDSPSHPDRRHHRFFDSKPVGGTSTPRRSDQRWDLIPKAATTLEVDPGAIAQFAHYGYVYCMIVAIGPTVLVEPDEEVLISGGGDGTIKLWRIRQEEEYKDLEEWEAWEKRQIMVLGEPDPQSVMSLAIDGSFLYSGKLKGIIELWDLDTKQKLRVIKGHRGDTMTLQLSWGSLWSAAATGSAAKHSTVHYGKDHKPSSSDDNVSQKYQCLRRWQAHEGKILASACTSFQGEKLYITGANDNAITVWRVADRPTTAEEVAEKPEDMIFASLREFISYKTVSSRQEFGEDCRRGASFLCTLFKRLGAEVEMLSTDQLHNPIVYAKFSGKFSPAEKRKRILFYGHYDVVPADRNTGSKWLTDPFTMHGMNGYLYGRGVSDNKGPIMAALYAVTDLMQAKQLDSDVIFLIEGEEESGSRGFQETIKKKKEMIGNIDYILLANSYWVDDETPCLTYGLRGVLHATVCVDSLHPDLHSGVDGSYLMSEPLSDLTLLMSKLKGPKHNIMIPHFYDSILPLTPAEDARYEDITKILVRRNPEAGSAELMKQGLMARWREPNLTIHGYKVSGPDGSLVSSHASAKISLRLVPGQELEDIIAALTAFLKTEFAELESKNTLSVKIDNMAEPWLGDPNNEIFRTLEEAIVKVWGLSGGPQSPAKEPTVEKEENDSGANPQSDGSDDAKSDSSPSENGAAPAGVNSGRKPLYIREGGSIPAIRFLEKEFGAPAAHLPCGQATDAAHLENERMRVLNLLKSRQIFGEVFQKL